MNARLSSLLVAGGVVLAGIQTGSLHAAPFQEALAPKVTLLSTSMESTGSGVKVFLCVPGMVAQPGVQVLSNPHRIVIDLPGVDRGTAVTRKDLAQLAHPLIQKARLAQFAAAPKPVTRLVLEVIPGTQVVVGSSGDGVQLLLTPGEGRVQARFDGTLRPQVVPPSPVLDVASITPVRIDPPVPPVVAQTALPAVLQPVLPPVPVKPLAALPAVGSSFQSLPQLAVSTVMTMAAPEAIQTPEPERSSPPASGRASGRTLGESLATYTGSKITIDLQNTEIRDFLRILADTGKLNLVMDPDVQGNFGFKFTDTPWDQVLDVVLKGVISQRLVPRADGIGRVPAVEVLISTARVRECITEKDKTNEINDAIAKGQTAYGMQSFDQSLMFLMKEGLITYEEALKHCTNPDDFALRVKGILATSDTTWEDFEVLEKEKEETKETGKQENPEKPVNLRMNERGGKSLKQ